MTVKVYVWLPRIPSVGHASMELDNGTYISLWPGEDKTGKKKKRKKIKKGKKDQHDERSENLDEDIYNEDRSQDYTFRIYDLDEGAIQRWWDNFDGRWRLIGQNCCDTVIGGLRAGGSDGKLSFSDRIHFRTVLIWTPVTVAEYCRKLPDRPSAHNESSARNPD